MRKVDKLEEMEKYWQRVGGYLPEIGDIRKVKSRDDLMAWLYTDTFWTNYWLQECGYLADMIMMDCWSKLDVKIFHTIGVNVVVDNISYFDKDEVLKVVGCGDTQWRESVGKLEKANMIRMLDNRLEKRTQRVCKITPAAYWKGNLGVRNMYIQNWYRASREGSGEWLLPEGVV